jgi:CheY-like chemotaxis protein
MKREVYEVKRDERELEHLEFQLRVLRSISHDIRTNINEIQGYLTFLQKKELSQEEIGYLLRARHATEALRYSVDKMLNFSSLNAEELELKRSWFFLDDLIVDVAEFTAGLAAEKGLRLLLDVETGSSPVYGDARRLEEMLRYLLENAVKFTSRGSVMLKVRHRPDENGEAVEITIRDSGIGMSPAEVREVCEPYVRFAEGEKGLGLGLYFSRVIAEKMGALLQIESVPREGTSVRLELHLEGGDEVPEPYGHLSGKRLALFHDRNLRLNPEVQQLTLEVLEGLGMQVDFFDDEEAFIQYLIAGGSVPDLVSVATLPEHYGRFGMLFAFLRKSHTFARTLFVAERLGNQLLPENFDQGFEGHAGARGYLESLEKGRERPASEGLRILIVDDLASNIEILQLFLGKIAPDARIDTAQGGYEAIGMFKTRRYDLVLMDLKMPGLDGFQVLKRFEDIGPLPPVYAVSAEVYEATRQQIEDSRFSGLLEKPFNPEKLNNVVKEAIHAKHHR